MSRSPVASQPLRQGVVVFGLCLLAFFFAMEAKLAWYGPVAGLGSDVRAAKEIPASTPKVVNHGVPTPDPMHPKTPSAGLSAVAAAWLAGICMPAGGEIVHNPPALFPPTYDSPPLFLRSPPLN